MPINNKPLYQQQALETLTYVSLENETNFPTITSNGSVPPVAYNKTARLVYDVSKSLTHSSPFGDNSSVDAFGRLRVSSPITLFDSKVLHQKTTLDYNEALSGSATIGFVEGDSLVQYNTTNQNDYAIRQSNLRFNYQPGKSNLGLFSCLLSAETDVVKRVGFFQGASAAPYEPTDGAWFEMTQNGPYFVTKKTKGTSFTSSTPQSAWSIDKFDGTGPSGINLDFTKAQIIAMDYEWLGIGRQRFGFVVNGQLLYAHYVSHLNGLTAPYISYPNQPVRYELRQQGSTPGSMKQICASVINEGADQQPLGTLCTVNLSSTVSCATTGWTFVIGVRTNPSYPNTVSMLRTAEILNTSTNADCMFKIFNYDVSFSNGSTPTWTNIPNTNLQYAVGNGTITLSGGHELKTGFVAGGQGSQSTSAESELLGLNGRFGVSINGTPQMIVIGARGITNSAAVYAAMNLIQAS